MFPKPAVLADCKTSSSSKKLRVPRFSFFSGLLFRFQRATCVPRPSAPRVGRLSSRARFRRQEAVFLFLLRLSAERRLARRDRGPCPPRATSCNRPDRLPAPLLASPLPLDFCSKEPAASLSLGAPFEVGRVVVEPALCVNRLSFETLPAGRDRPGGSLRANAGGRL